MRAGDPGFEISKNGDPGTWKIGVEPGSAWKKPGAWGTPFSAFRFAIPELCEFKGRAVYIDADMLVLGDVRELLECELRGGYRCISLHRTDVSVIDCEWFRNKEWWPTIAEMRPSGRLVWHYCQGLMQHNGISPTLPREWNACDQTVFTGDPGIATAKLLHFTTVPTQPYRPYPTVKYYDHPWASWVECWRQHLEEARAVR